MIKIADALDNFEPQASSSNYTRFAQPGTYRLRVLTESIAGYSWWLDTPDGGRKPKRIPLSENPPVEFAEQIKKFLAFVVYNYEQKRIQVWEVSQISIQKALIGLKKDADWGNLMDYDIAVSRVGQGKNDTKYTVTPKPKADPSPELVKAMADGLPNLEALYKGEDPFTWFEGQISVKDAEKAFEEHPDLDKTLKS